MTGGGAIDRLALVGVSHHNAPVEVRERLAIPQDDTEPLLADLQRRGITTESLALSTCNRTELYCLTDHPELVIERTLDRTGRDTEGMRSLFYVKRGREMIRHAFAVASGLDSMILGEPEILGQMKKAYAAARQENFAGPALSRVFERGFNVAKLVRTETSISRETVSTAALCSQLAGDVFGDLSSCHTLVVGAGAIVESVAEHFANAAEGSLTIANRTLRRASLLARRFGADTLAYEDVTQALERFDVVITATSSVLPVLGKGALERACRRRRRKPIVVFDLAVPRDVEPEAAELEDLFLHSIDDLGRIVGDNLEKRRAASQEAEHHIAVAADELIEWFERRGTVDVVKDIVARLDAVRSDESARALREIDAAGDPQAVIEKLARRLVNRLAHYPLQALSDHHANRDLVDEISSWYTNDDEDHSKHKD